MLGVRDACDFSRATHSSVTRSAGDRPPQALAFLITDMQMALDGARLLVHEAAWRVDSGLPCAGAAAAAFAQCIRRRLIGPAGVQILGGHSFMADYPMEKAMRESRARALARRVRRGDRVPGASCATPGLALGSHDRFRIDGATREALARARVGRRDAPGRPGGGPQRAAARRASFAKFIERGGGRTRWSAGRCEARGRAASVVRAALVEARLGSRRDGRRPGAGPARDERARDRNEAEALPRAVPRPDHPR
jgi:hypothetical protein